MSEPKSAKEFIEENYIKHDYEIGPDDDPRQSNYVRKDGSYQVADSIEIAEAYADQYKRQLREEALRANSWKAQIETRLAEAIRAIELEKRARTVDRDKISELRKQVKGVSELLKKMSDEG